MLSDVFAIISGVIVGLALGLLGGGGSILAPPCCSISSALTILT